MHRHGSYQFVLFYPINTAKLPKKLHLNAVPNFTLAGDWTYQKFLGSMEGAVLAGKLAATVVATKTQSVRPVRAEVVAAATAMSAPRNPRSETILTVFTFTINVFCHLYSLYVYLCRGLVKTAHDLPLIFGGGSQRRQT